MSLPIFTKRQKEAKFGGAKDAFLRAPMAFAKGDFSQTGDLLQRGALRMSPGATNSWNLFEGRNQRMEQPGTAIPGWGQTNAAIGTEQDALNTMFKSTPQYGSPNRTDGK